ncbi:MAG: hypothetical protein LRZ88_12885 [Candidatus Cloacimonetes bacterium]|nr:hypothetical protein [Candidatus Cloacimonadota bacterium]
MKRALIIMLGLTLFILAACSEESTKLTQVNMGDLKVPQDFNYNMNNQVSVNLQGHWRLPVYVTTTNGNLLFKAQLNPATGLNTRLTLPKTIKQVVVQYQMYEQTIDVSGGTLNFDFRNAK